MVARKAHNLEVVGSTPTPATNFKSKTMATRNMIMVVPEEYGFNEHGLMTAVPNSVEEKSYLNLYMHHDGYPEWQGVQLANWRLANPTMDIARASAKLVRDMYYDSSYLYPSVNSIDHQYTYIVWVGKENNKISCFDRYNSKHIFTMTPNEIKTKYADDMDYTDFAKGETRCRRNNTIAKEELATYNKVRANAQNIIDILTHSD